MFSFLKPKPAPEGPVEFIVAVEIDRPAAEVYPLIDWADPRNAKRQLGHSIEPLGGDPARFRLIMTGMEDLRFEMTVIEAEQDRRYAFSTDITPPVGRLVESAEHYSLEPLGDDRCKLTLKTVATFQSGLDMDEFEEELMMMTMSCQRALVKYKLHAEQGVDAVKAFDQQLDF